MERTHSVAIIGLGAIGRRMLANMPQQGRLRVTGGWDLNAEVRAAAARDFPWLPIPDAAEDLIDASDTDIVYIGVPPRAHAAYADAATAAGKAIFCEKPLGVDLAESRALVARVAAARVPAAVNLSLSGARATGEMRAALTEGRLGAVRGLDIRLHFGAWPRPFQADAVWLAERIEGGFTREVATHFLYLARTLLGPGRVVSTSVRYPAEPAAETHVVARYEFAGVPVTLAGSVGGVGPDRVEATLWGAVRSYRLTEFYRLWQSEGGQWEAVFPDLTEPGQDAYMRQLDHLVAMLDGAPHALPDFRTALEIQTLVEGTLRTDHA